MAGGSGQGPRPSSLHSESRDRDGSPPPPYSPWPVQQQKRPPSRPPAYHSGTSRVDERTSLLPPVQHSRERVTIRRETFTLTWKRWTASGRRGYQKTRHHSYACAKPCMALLALLTTLLLTGVVLFAVAFCLKALWQWGMSIWPKPAPIPTYAVAIIGAGPAGISAAQHLRAPASGGGMHLNITVFEASPSVGGKLALFSETEPETGDPLVYPWNDSRLDPLSAEDVAGPALMWNNPLFARASEEVFEDAVEFFELPPQEVGYYPTNRRTTRPYKATPTLSWLGQIWHYGASVWRAGALISSADDLLRKHIPAVASKKPHQLPRTIPDLLDRLGADATRLAREWASDSLRARGVGDAYAHEVFGPQARSRGGGAWGTGMGMGVTGLAMALAAAQEDGACGRTVARPDHDFLSRLTAIADTLPGVDVRVRSRVVGVERERYGDEDGDDDDDGDGSGAGKRDTWALRLEDTTPSLGRRHGRDVGSEAELFDFVIMAAPGLEGTVYQQRVRASNSTSESTSNKDNVEAEDAVDFASAHLMFVTRTSRLADPVPGAGGDGDGASLPPQFLFVDNNNDGGSGGVGDARGVRGVEHVRDVVRYADGDATGRIEHLYRYITDEDISGLLATDPAVTWMYHYRLDHAFPLPYPRTTYPPFEVGDGLWTTGAIHSIGSTVDLSWLAGRIVAQRVVESARGRR